MFLLQLKYELWKLFGKKRTYIGFGMFLLAQNAILIICHFPNIQRKITRLLETNGFTASGYLSVLTMSTIMITAMAFTLLPLYSALVGGDLVAKEVEDGTLRMILCRPISRFRLLLLKWIAGGIFSFLLVLSLGTFGIVFSLPWFPWGGLFTMPPALPFGLLDATRGFECYIICHICMFPKALTILTLAFMFSCFNMKPAAATVLALSLLFIITIMQDLPFFQDYHNWFFTYHMNIWREAFNEKIPWWKMAESMFWLVGYNVTFFVIGFTAFQMRDIKS
jgi:ABC-2 type transport system permease protein